jgi:hypothetical protein
LTNLDKIIVEGLDYDVSVDYCIVACFIAEVTDENSFKPAPSLDAMSIALQKARSSTGVHRKCKAAKTTHRQELVLTSIERVCEKSGSLSLRTFTAPKTRYISNAFWPMLLRSLYANKEPRA